MLARCANLARPGCDYNDRDGRLKSIPIAAVNIGQCYVYVMIVGVLYQPWATVPLQLHSCNCVLTTVVCCGTSRQWLFVLETRDLIVTKPVVEEVGIDQFSLLIELHGHVMILVPLVAPPWASIQRLFSTLKRCWPLMSHCWDKGLLTVSQGVCTTGAPLPPVAVRQSPLPRFAHCAPATAFAGDVAMKLPTISVATANIHRPSRDRPTDVPFLKGSPEPKDSSMTKHCKVVDY